AGRILGCHVVLVQRNLRPVAPVAVVAQHLGVAWGYFALPKDRRGLTEPSPAMGVRIFYAGGEYVRGFVSGLHSRPEKSYFPEWIQQPARQPYKWHILLKVSKRAWITVTVYASDVEDVCVRLAINRSWRIEVKGEPSGNAPQPLHPAQIESNQQ